MHRRSRFTLLPSLALFAALAAPAAAQFLTSGVATGDVTQTTAVLWARGDATGVLRWEISPDRNFVSDVRSFTADVTDTLLPVKALVPNLAPGTRYYVRAVDAAGGYGATTFRTPAALGARDGLRFGVTGDSRGDNAPYWSMTNVAERSLDVIVLLGDTIYADIESPALPGVAQATTLQEFRRKHAEIVEPRAGLNSMRLVRASTPILASIDDHEVTNDFSGGAPAASDPRFGGPEPFINETPLYTNGIVAFHEWFPIDAETYGATGTPRTDGKRKLYRRRWYGSDAAIHVLDARSFRDEGLTPADPTNPADIGRFIAESFDPSRTMLGRVQVEELKADLLAAHTAGIRWKFVIVPEPIQNLGVAAASDRFEGYAAERTEVLRFIDDNDISNVVFVAADIHGTVVNDVQYQLGPGQPHIDSGAFEVTTGAIAFDAPFGPTVVSLANTLGIIDGAGVALYQSLNRFRKDVFVRLLIDTQLALLGYTRVGIEATSPVDAELLRGDWVNTHTWGWTEFEIAPETQVLTIRTYGVEPLTANETPAVVQLIRVTPQP